MSDPLARLPGVGFRHVPGRPISEQIQEHVALHPLPPPDEDEAAALARWADALTDDQGASPEGMEPL